MKDNPTILFDSQTFRRQKYGGISFYFAGLLKHLPAEGIRPKIFHYLSRNANFNAVSQPSWAAKAILSANFKGKPRLMKKIEQIEYQRTLRVLSSGRYDLFHPTYYDDYFLKSLPEQKPFVLTVHDMIHELYFRKEYQRDYLEITQKQALIPSAARIIAISNYTKNDIMLCFPQLPPDRIEVIHHGLDLDVLQPARPTNHLAPLNYLLFVGDRRYYKNFTWLAENLAGWLKKEKVSILCYGSSPFDAHEKSLLVRLGLEHLVSHQPYKDFADLCRHYRNAIVFVFPSLYEGFGYPILEAFHNGCPTLLANASCFPEIAGDAALYFSPDNGDDLREKLSLLKKDGEFRKELIRRGKERAMLFDRSQSVKKHADLYRSILN